MNAAMGSRAPVGIERQAQAAAGKAHRAQALLDRLRLASEAAGLVLLSTRWEAWNSSYSFGCREGHRFERTGNFAIYHENACPHCREANRLAQLKLAAERKGGQCLETDWLGRDAAHRFQCAHGHAWKTTPSKIINDGSWCRRCAQQEHSRRMMREDGWTVLQDIAAAKGGSVLDTGYAGLQARYRFSCAYGHHWQAQGAEVMRGSWCGACANADKSIRYRLRDGLERLQAAARARQGACLSSGYILARSSYRFRCHKGHEWQTSGVLIFHGAWCPTCANENKRLSIEQMQQVAQARGGFCLSEQYRNNAVKLHWECHRGHRWHAPASRVLQGHWCPMCAHFNRITNPKSKAWIKYRPTT